MVLGSCFHSWLELASNPGFPDCPVIPSQSMQSWLRPLDKQYNDRSLSHTVYATVGEHYCTSQGLPQVSFSSMPNSSPLSLHLHRSTCFHTQQPLQRDHRNLDQRQTSKWEFLHSSHYTRLILWYCSCDWLSCFVVVVLVLLYRLMFIVHSSQ